MTIDSPTDQAAKQLAPPGGEAQACGRCCRGAVVGDPGLAPNLRRGGPAQLGHRFEIGGQLLLALGRMGTIGAMRRAMQADR